MSEDLTAWLLACLDEDEHVARHAIQETTGRWTHRETDWGGGPVIEDDCGALILPTGRHGNAQYPHIAAWNPARVLVECDTKRRIIAQHQTVPVAPGRREVTCLEDGSTSWPCPTLRLMALPYRERDGYRDSWAPDGR